MNPLRIRSPNKSPVRATGDFVLYWMTAFRRPRWNYSLDRAVDHARRLGKPLVVLEALRVGYPWASDRLHRFVLDGMADNEAAFEGTGVLYYPYLEPEAGAGSGLLESLARRAAVVVTDDFPCFFLPRMIAAAARKLEAVGTPLEAVDGNGLYPMRDTDRVFARAFDFRRHLQKRLPELFDDRPRAHPLRGKELPPYRLPAAITKRWPRAPRDLLSDPAASLDFLPIDHGVAATGERGGERAGRKRLKDFVERRLSRYEERNHPDADAASGLSPYLHFGHVSGHEVFSRLTATEDWSSDDVSLSTKGQRSGWWGMTSPAEGFLDEVLTWRELGYNMCSHREDYDRFESLPDWARETLAEHAGDPRPHVYAADAFESAATHDPIWNAAQRQLLTEGRLHNYLRMLWGKKILHWSRSPEEALDTMIELNNKYALDGRNPNSYSGIFWVLGRYDRAWGPERPVFGKIRYMSSQSTMRKLRLSAYLERYAPAPTGRARAVGS